MTTKSGAREIPRTTDVSGPAANSRGQARLALVGVGPGCEQSRVRRGWRSTGPAAANGRGQARLPMVLVVRVPLARPVAFVAAAGLAVDFAAPFAAALVAFAAVALVAVVFAA